MQTERELPDTNSIGSRFGGRRGSHFGRSPVLEAMIKHMLLGDEQLLGAGDPDGERFAVFYRRHLPEVLRFVLRRVGDRELAADLTAEVFAAALEARTTFDRQLGDARGWLCAIASNKIVDSQRRGRVEDGCRRRLGMTPVMLEDDDLRRIDDIAAAGEAVGSSSSLLAALPPDTRAAVQARVLEERDYADIAVQLRCSESVVRKRVSRGLARLRSEIRESK
ncbi:MAG: RNA polymerase sigma factor [Actinomycetota bacterium]|nr:RNA polymerase sigma factor [Actinomycetota bacterium]